MAACAITAPGYVDVEAAGKAGKRLYEANCIVCHGVDGRGIEGLGISLVDSEFTGSATRAELTEFLTIGRMPNDPASITGRPMPAFAYLAQEDLAAVAGYLVTIRR